MQSFFDRLLEWVWSRFLMDFGPHLTPKMLPKWSQVGFQEQWKQWPAKIPKSLKNHWFFNDFGGFRGSKLEPKSIKNRSMMVSKTRSKCQWVLDGSWIDFRPILRGFCLPSWSQIGTKMLLKPIQQPIKKMITSWIDFGPILARFWLPTWPPKRESDLCFFDLCWLLGPSWGQDGPQDPQDPLKTPPQDPPKSP